MIYRLQSGEYNKEFRSLYAACKKLYRLIAKHHRHNTTPYPSRTYIDLDVTRTRLHLGYNGGYRIQGGNSDILLADISGYFADLQIPDTDRAMTEFIQDKHTYSRLRADLENKRITEDDISELFISKYVALDTMYIKGDLAMNNNWNIISEYIKSRELYKICKHDPQNNTSQEYSMFN